MFKLFKKQDSSQPIQLPQVAQATTMQAVEPAPRSVDDIIAEIHENFFTAGDKQLQEARDIIAGITKPEDESLQALAKLGFSKTKGMDDYNKRKAIKEQNEKVALALEYAATHYPQYKFITRRMAQAICEKYGLMFGAVSRYMGHVPEKNVKEIAAFFKEENDLNTVYFQSGQYGAVAGSVYYCSKEEYVLQQNGRSSQSGIAYWHYHPIQKSPCFLNIAAPAKEMDTTNADVKGVFIHEKPIPDPVVMAEVYIQNCELYCILSAWGKEASDEMVVNQKMN